MARIAGAHGQFGLQTDDDTLAVGVLRTHQRTGLDAVEHQVGFRVDQGVVDPVGHLGGPADVAVTGQEDPGRTVGRGVEELVLLAPRDTAALGG